ncbi:site-2 protease family protein [Neptunomonas sp.]|uniref:site-2 protease family protein n=1 Tax=Neptunomonas sp. TaxID=1971898 RepID=UPI00356B0C0F
MSVSLFSPSWHRVAELKPRLRSHVVLNRHIYRGAVWYVIQDDATGRYHRFTPQAYCLIGLMNGRRTLDDLWHSAGEQLGDDMPSQDEVIQLLSQLYRVDVIQTDVIPDIGELNKRRRKEKQNRLLAAIKSPLAVKIPLIDPEPFLSRTAGISRWIFNPLTGFIWLFSIGWALTQAVYHWPELTENLSDRVLAVENLFLIWLVYPVVKLIHEFGHAYAVKRWGGEVHEMGVMFLIFMPIPYVDASASAAFHSKYQRMLVAAAGILVEAFIAAMAMWVWVSVEPGVVRSMAFNTLLISGVSTLLFNGNPLLRFDAYYVLSDFLEIPNLASRGTRQITYLCKKYLFGFGDVANSAAYSKGEANWLVFYAIASFIYRVFITFTIVLFVASELFFVGIILAVLSLYNMFGKPTLGVIKFLAMDRTVKKNRSRVFLSISSLVILLWLIFFIIPLPKMTVAHGVVWAPDESQVLAGSSGFLQQLVVTPGAMVKVGDTLLISNNDELDAKVAEYVGRLKELLVRYQTAVADLRQSEVSILAEEIAQARAELKRSLEEQRELVVKSPANGRYQLALPVDPEGRFIPRGTLLGYVLQPGEYRVRAAVSQDDIPSVRSDVQTVTVRIAEQIDHDIQAQLASEVPGAQKTLPSPALSVEGGGLFALDPTNKEQPEAFETVFLVDLQLAGSAAYRVGERAYVRFEHTPEPIGYRIYRDLRRILLRELDY